MTGLLVIILTYMDCPGLTSILNEWILCFKYFSLSFLKIPEYLIISSLRENWTLFSPWRLYKFLGYVLQGQLGGFRSCFKGQAYIGFCRSIQSLKNSVSFCSTDSRIHRQIIITRDLIEKSFPSLQAVLLYFLASLFRIFWLPLNLMMSALMLSENISWGKKASPLI